MNVREITYTYRACTKDENLKRMSVFSSEAEGSRESVVKFVNVLV
jgi:hypothetical protein